MSGMLSQIAKSTPRVTATKNMALRLYTPWLKQFDTMRKKEAHSAAAFSTSCFEGVTLLQNMPSQIAKAMPRVTATKNMALRLYTPWLMQFDTLRKKEASSADTFSTQPCAEGIAAPTENMHLKKSSPRLTACTHLLNKLNLYTPWLKQFDASRKQMHV
eukprot:gnl/TRDRNA2_/TRDRNA2_42715_c0_seq2.p2 gnl/TRDRNA2_/TRDRNA2_42715_c0~~gnl/TRDRNA2_/TRDRNA2_42715_c0_seq2.p2  ORF type:complete len:159 (-),score=29.13 gnl/TRDRNA2_/TRDRNA2_42715_c0_seq2:274-750(-)